MKIKLILMLIIISCINCTAKSSLIGSLASFEKKEEVSTTPINANIGKTNNTSNKTQNAKTITNTGVESKDLTAILKDNREENRKDNRLYLEILSGLILAYFGYKLKNNKQRKIQKKYKTLNEVIEDCLTDEQYGRVIKVFNEAFYK